MEWDPNLWQGRRKDQVERNNKITYYATLLLLISVLIALILA
jgi:hypothetical protein